MQLIERKCYMLMRISLKVIHKGSIDTKPPLIQAPSPIHWCIYGTPHPNKLMADIKVHCHWSPTVPVSVWLPEPARDRGSKQETLNNDFYHTTSRSAAIFGVQGGRSYLVLALTLWIGLCPMKRSSGVWNFGDVSVTYRRSFGNHTLAGPYVPVTYYRNRL